VALVKCGVCGKVGKGYSNHREDHVVPPRELNICLGCHCRVHEEWRRDQKVEVCSDPNCWVYRLLEGRLTNAEKAAFYRMVSAELNRM